MKQEYPIHSAPYHGTNNRKKTLSRLIDDKRNVQSVPIYEEDKNGIKTKFLGWRYVRHLTPQGK